jgi:hypothetical protein
MKHFWLWMQLLASSILFIAILKPEWLMRRTGALSEEKRAEIKKSAVVALLGLIAVWVVPLLMYLVFSN